MLRRSVDLLPEIFQTDTNKKFLSATLDQLTQEPSFKRTYGYIGRRVGPGINPADSYVTEPTQSRSDYQLEPGVAFFQPNTTKPLDAITYPGMIDALNIQGGITGNQDRLFESEFYSWDPFCDLDKFTNYSQYYWLPGGPDSVDVFSSEIALTADYDVGLVTQGYKFSGIADVNPNLKLVRGGSYTFNVNQKGNPFWIQAAPGISGTMSYASNISSRDVLGVENNGAQEGTITFNVPLKTDQDFFYNLNNVGNVDLVTNLYFEQINNVYVDTFLQQNPSGIDGIKDLQNRTVILVNTSQEPDNWEVTTQFDPLPRDDGDNFVIGSFDSTLFDQAVPIEDRDYRYAIYRIEYVGTVRPFMRLQLVSLVPEFSKVSIQFGTVYSNTQWYKDATGFWQQVPLLTAVLDTLYYQDGEFPLFTGTIQLIDPEEIDLLDVNDIIGAKNFTSPNGVKFTNGLKVQFRGPTNPPEYQNLEFYVEGVGTGPGIEDRVGFIDGEAYFGPWHEHDGQKMTGSTHSTDTFQQYIYDTVEESLANEGAGGPAGAPLPTVGIFGATEGNGIKLLPVTDFVTPERYTESATIPYDSTPYDNLPYDAALNDPAVRDYITINRASQDRNAWSRSNRWFHIDVIEYTATLNNQIAALDNNQRAQRPIIEFRANTKLFDFGTQGKDPVDMIDFQETDALTNINGQRGYSTDGYTFIQGSRVIFAADVDPQVRNKIYQVDFVDPNNDGVLTINLVPTDDSLVLVNQCVVVLDGINQKGKSYYFDGLAWLPAQQKLSVNQPPLFDVYDINGFSYGNRALYSSTTFRGSRLFGYAVGTVTERVDQELGFALKYLNIDNVGDILFENYFYTDTFIYVQGDISITTNVSEGIVRQYIDRTEFSDEIGWQTAAQKNRSRQVFKFTYADAPLVLDIPASTDSIFNAVQLFISGNYISPEQYTVAITSTNTTITFTSPPAIGTIIEVQVISNVESPTGFYQVPLNLENNPLNENSPNFTLGTIRNYYISIGENHPNVQGPIIGANNTRDLGNILRYGDSIVQHSSPLALTGVFLRRQQYELFNALNYNSQEYQKYKNLVIDMASRGDFVNNTPSQILDDIIIEIGLGKNSISPFYWSDMIPAGSLYTETVYTYTPISIPTFDTVNVYDFTSSNYHGLLVYLNGQLLVKDYDYTVGIDSPTVTVTNPLKTGDTITIREYSQTYGTFVPNTPTKMGLYPSFKPDMYLDETYVNPTMVIRGHDGSITVAFGDYRDDVLLEFEKRIFNNIKIQSKIPLDLYDIIPGQFRKTDYSLSEINQILVTDFLSWVGANKLDYTAQSYLANNQFTYNYSQSSNRLDNQPLLGAWRGIFNYFYDTMTPNTTPWEMIGLSEEPSWWEGIYGPAPYTSGNMVLWDDLAMGLIADPDNPRIDPKFVRPGLLDVIPSGTEGELLPPLEAVVGNYDATSFRRSWVFGDDGPVENAWRTSSAWPFSVMRLLALTKPAEFFSLFADRDRYVYDEDLAQYLWDGRYRLDAKKLSPLYGDGTSKASYINWIIDYNRQLGKNSTQDLEDSLNNIGVRLCWRMGAFSDKQYLKFYADRATPNSLNTSLLIPDENYTILLYKNQPFETASYSSVIVQIVDGGYAVFGYSIDKPYFNILASRINGRSANITVAGTSVRVNLEYTNNVVKIPYGYVFSNTTAVCDFLLSYGELLQRQGFVFDTRENGYILDWQQMAQEFLYWSQQGWSTGSIINLNPAAQKITISRPQAVVDSILNPTPENLVLNQNRQPISAANLNINRIENVFSISSVTSDTINLLNLKFTAFEHIAIFDNTSIFADVLYDPITGSRQGRLLTSGWLSGEWTGLLNAPGFVLNQDNILPWVPTKKYAKGEIVSYKNEYWSASTIIQPSQEFNYNLWIKSDYDEIQKGLLPNAANVSDQLASAYSVYNANLEQEVDLFSYGLIGFRPREYMQALNLDDVSQVNLYQQFLGSKGTLRSAEIFTLANLGKETAEYDIYEYWGIQAGIYGANANRSYVELRLNEALLLSDPSLVQVTYPSTPSLADQAIIIQDIWKSSYPVTSPNILPTTTSPLMEVGLPTAGYVRLDDVDLTVFSFDDAQVINDSLASVGIGTLIWVAKINPYEWSVYRVEAADADIAQVSDNLDGRALVKFSSQHNLDYGAYLIIRFFDPAIDGVYRVQSIPDPTSVLIDYQFVSNPTTVTGQGIGLTLKTARVDSPVDIGTLSYVDSLLPGAKVWVDNNGSGLWTVLEKTQPFVTSQSFVPDQLVENTRFGSSVAQGLRNLSALVGAPEFGTDGAVYTYVRTDQNVYAENITLELGTTDTVGYGNAVDMGDQIWGVAGASNSLDRHGYAAVIRNFDGNNFEQWQLLTPVTDDLMLGDGSTLVFAASLGPAVSLASQIHVFVDGSVQTQGVDYNISFTLTDVNVTFVSAPANLAEIKIVQAGAEEFGYSVLMSRDEQWLYVGAPGANRVYAYGLIESQTQSVSYKTDGVTISFNYSDYIDIDPGQYNQLLVVLNGTLQTLGVDYSVDSNAVTFLSAPALGQDLLITRQFAVDEVGDGSTQTFSIAKLALADNIYSFSVYLDNVLQRPNIDYQFNDVARSITFAVPPAIDTAILIRSGSYYTLVDVITDGTLVSTARFGHSVSSTTDGRQITIGAPGTETNKGSVQVFARSVERFIVNDISQYSFVTINTLIAPTAVYLNGVALQQTTDLTRGNFTVLGSNTVVLQDITLAIGDIIEIETNQFNFIQDIVANLQTDRAQFGYATDICPLDCSLYIGAPYDSVATPEAGMVEFHTNQARVYGLIRSLHQYQTEPVANAVYTPSWSGTGFYQLTQTVNGVPYYTFISSGLTVGDYLSINNTWVEVTGSTLQDLVDDISNAQIPNVAVRISDGYLVLSAVNTEVISELNKLQVLPGSGSVFSDLGFDVYIYQQTIVSPVAQAYANFGQAVYVADNSVELIVGAPNGSLILPTTFDEGTTAFDGHSTTFVDFIEQSGAVYTFDYLTSVNPSATNPGQFIFGQQIYDPNVQSFDRFGAALNYTSSVLIVGSPGFDAGDSSINYGRILTLDNPGLRQAWSVLRLEQPVVDIRLLNTIFMYDIVKEKPRQYFDYFDPLQGRVLGVVQENLDFIGAVDPAAYTVGEVNNYGNKWAQDRVGQIWWNTTNCRFIDPNQDDIIYASRRWGQLFPGSVVEIYQWIESEVPPSEYIGPGIPYSETSYVVTSLVDEQGLFVTNYYFWVKGLRTVNRAAKKTLSIDAMTNYITDPKSSGIAYIAPLNASTFAIYNGKSYIVAQDTVLHVEFDKELTEQEVHIQYQLIPQDRSDGFLNPNLYTKLLDSFCGVDVSGNPVPDPMLPVSEQIGVQFRPRQSMFANRFAALKNYILRANRVMKEIPIAEGRLLNLLNISDPPPSQASGAWDKRVANHEELAFQNLNAVPLGYRYLVDSDAPNNGLWAIYEVQQDRFVIRAERSLQLVRVQTYDTRRYWSYIDWYAPGFSSLTLISREVPNYASLTILDVPNGTNVKVTDNTRGKWEIYRLVNGKWQRIGLQDGTIAISEKVYAYADGRFGFDSEVFDLQYFDQEPTRETRNILRAINEELFIGDLLIERNRLLMLMFNYILNEEEAPGWLNKTSLIDVNHTIRELIQFQSYRRDNQDFVLNYIQEVKPYHVQIREFNLRYKGFDEYLGSLTDFDLPAYYDAAQNLYISPILDDTGTQSTTSSIPSTSPVWQTFPYNQWYNNYLLQVESVQVIDGGSGYTVPPQVQVTGQAQTQAVMVARINTAGQIIAIDVLNAGAGYTTTAEITLIGGNGTGAKVKAVMGNNLVRDIKTTIKYDRYQYQSTVLTWEPNVTYSNGTLVRYNDRVWSANNTSGPSVTGPDFDPLEWVVVAASELSGVDRTMGYYVPTENEPGLDLALLINGVDYPGVQVMGLNFTDGPGFDIAPFDSQPFDNFAYGPEGKITYDPSVLDTIYESYFGTAATGPIPTGEAFTDINVDGGAFVDTYSSHAPEELVPGAIFDTLDMRVFTTPGSDWADDGHGFNLEIKTFTFESLDPYVSFEGLVQYPSAVRIYNQSRGIRLILDVDYSVDWFAQTIYISNAAAASDGERVTVSVYELGGGNQLFRDSYTNEDLDENNSLIIPVQLPLIEAILIYLNGSTTYDFYYEQATTSSVRLVFNNPLPVDSYLQLTVFGAPYDSSYSQPYTSNYVYAGSPAFVVSNWMSGTNPPNAVVEINGIRARPPEGIEYIADGSSSTFFLPDRGGYSPDLVANNDVSVYVDTVPLVLGVGFFVDPWDGSTLSRSVTLTTVPPAGSQVLISVRTAADYYFTNNTLVWKPETGFQPSIGDVISVTTWENTTQHDILTKVFQGPTVTGIETSQPYDSTAFDTGSVTGDPGSYDYGTGLVVETNRFDLGRAVPDASRLIVTLNGLYLWDNQSYISGTERSVAVFDSYIEIAGPALHDNDVVAITMFTNSVVPGPIAFRIFQDMQGIQTTYRITDPTTTTLIENISQSDDVIYVNDIAVLDTPNLATNIFGAVTIDGERITYRYKELAYEVGPADGLNAIWYMQSVSYNEDTANNLTVSLNGIQQTSGFTVVDYEGALGVEFDTIPAAGVSVGLEVNIPNAIFSVRRGTAGTGAAPHVAGTDVYNIGLGNALPIEYQDKYELDDFLADGVQTSFTAENVIVDGVDSTTLVEAVLVYVGGIRTTTGYSITSDSPLVVTFDEPPTKGYQVSIRVRKGLSWYQPGVDTASNGIALQEQTTDAARFIKGQY